MTYLMQETGAEFSPKDPSEIITLTFQFGHIATSALSSPVVTVIHTGGIADAAASSMVLGSATVTGTDITQRIQAGVDGANYLVRCMVDSDSNKYVIAGVLKVRYADGIWNQASQSTEVSPLTGSGGSGTTDLGYTASPTGGQVTSSTGTSAAIPLSDATNAGLMSPAQHTKLAGLGPITVDATPTDGSSNAVSSNGVFDALATKVETAADIAAIVNAAASKTTPVDADAFAGIDSASSYGLKKFTWANIKATLATYFDAAYLKLTGGVLAGGIRTASGSTLKVTETWNNASVAFPGAVVVDVTDTASAAGSLLADFKVGGTSKVFIDKGGNVRFGRGDYDGVAVISNGSKYSSLYLGVDGSAQLSVSKHKVASNGVPFSAQWGGSFEIDAANGGTDVVRAYLDAANVWAQRNGTNAQTFRVYNTYTSGSNRENFAVSWASNICTIGTEESGATKRALIVDGSTVSIAAPLYVKQYTTATRPAWVNGAQIFDTDLDKLLIGGVSAWEVVTSV